MLWTCYHQKTDFADVALPRCVQCSNAPKRWDKEASPREIERSRGGGQTFLCVASSHCAEKKGTSQGDLGMEEDEINGRGTRRGCHVELRDKKVKCRIEW